MNIKEYVIACTELYGMIHKDRVLHLYNMHHPNNPLSSMDVISNRTLVKNGVFVKHDFFIHEAFMIDNSMAEFLDNINGKPYYLPTEEELAHYLDEDELQLTPETIALQSYIESMVDLDGESLEDLMMELYYNAKHSGHTQHYFNSLSQYGVEFQDEDHAKAFLPALMAFHNNVRTWDNLGFTPIELRNRIHKAMKIGRNDPCPCGSGKKYKKCCIDKDLVDLNLGPLTYDNPFTLSEADIQAFQRALNSQADKIQSNLSQYQEPSLDELIQIVLEEGIYEYIDHRPQDIIGALAVSLMDIHMTKNDILVEQLFRTLRIWGIRDEINAIHRYMNQTIFNRFELVSDAELLETMIDLYYNRFQPIVKEIPNKRPYQAFLEAFDTTTYQEDDYYYFNQLCTDLFLSTLEDKLLHIYNIVLQCPYAHSGISFFMNENNTTDDQFDLLQAFIKSFEQSHEDVLYDPDVDFYTITQYKDYLMALDSLAYILKNNGHYVDAIPLYQKMLEHDTRNRFGAQEAILVCYMMTDQFDKFEAGIEQLEDESLYKTFLTLMIKVATKEPFHHEYLNAYETSKYLLDILTGVTEVNHDKLELFEKFFLEDFYEFYTYDKRLLQPLIDLHTESD